MKIYLALDGTADVTAAKRAEEAGKLGADALVCCLPVGKDPDDLTVEEIEAVRSDARPALEEWVTAIEGEADVSVRNELKQKLREQAREWIAAAPANGGEIRGRLGAGLGLTDGECLAWLGTDGNGRRKAEGGKQDGALVPSAFGLPPSDAGLPPSDAGGLEPLVAPGEVRAVISNFRWESRYTPDKKGRAASAGVEASVRAEWAELKALDRKRNVIGEDGKPVPLNEADANRLRVLVDLFNAKESRVDVALPMDLVRRTVQIALRGWPLRVAPEGCKSGILFADAGGGRVRMIENHVEFSHLLQEYGILKFNKGQDAELTNYVGMETVYTDFCSSVAVRSYAVVETVPHEPRIRGHYYVRQPAIDYQPDGSHLGMLVGFFNNIAKPEHKALFAAAIVTQFWGGPYGQRPAFVFEASQPGSGKSTAANVVARLTSVDGALSITLDKHGEERVRERMLSGEGMRKRVAMVDNIKGSVASAMLEAMVTEEWISGKRMYHGEASRPNTFTFLITSNNARLSSDMARRSFYIQFEKPEQADPHWKRVIDAFLEENMARVVADCLWVLRQPIPRLDWACNKGETFSLWCENVLARVLSVEAVRVVVGAAGGEVKAEDVIRANQAERNETDEERDEAETFWFGLLEALVAHHGYHSSALMSSLPKQDIFVRTSAPPSVRKKDTYDAEADDRDAMKNNMLSYWEAIFGREVNAKWLANNLDRHIEAGRLPGLRRGRTRRERGYYVDFDVICDYVQKKDEGDVSHASSEVRPVATDGACDG